MVDEHDEPLFSEIHLSSSFHRGEALWAQNQIHERGETNSSFFLIILIINHSSGVHRPVHDFSRARSSPGLLLQQQEQGVLDWDGTGGSVSRVSVMDSMNVLHVSGQDDPKVWWRLPPHWPLSGAVPHLGQGQASDLEAMDY